MKYLLVPLKKLAGTPYGYESWRIRHEEEVLMNELEARRVCLQSDTEEECAAKLEAKILTHSEACILAQRIKHNNA